MAGCATKFIAARICGNLVLGDYNDWYLSSKDELNKLYLNKTAIGGFTTGVYWISSENSTVNAWAQNFTDGSTLNMYKPNSGYVRAIRAFYNLTI